MKDPSRVVSQSAYLLFYRRRSDVPLGGPRFKQIIQDYDNPPDQQPPSEDEASESGEDQGLVGNSSLRGSSSALTGVGAARHQPNLGSADGEGTMTINPSALESLPAYAEHEEEAGSAPLLASDAAMNDGLGLQESIEDEGVDMSLGYNDHYSHAKQTIQTALSQGLYSQEWNFSALGSNTRPDHMISGTGSDVDAASDIVQHNSSADAESIRGRFDDFQNTIAEDDGIPFEDQSHVPDMDEEHAASAIALQAEFLERMNREGLPGPSGPSFRITDDDIGAERFEVEEPEVAEIYVSEDLKMN